MGEGCFNLVASSDDLSTSSGSYFYSGTNPKTGGTLVGFASGGFHPEGGVTKISTPTSTGVGSRVLFKKKSSVPSTSGGDMVVFMSVNTAFSVFQRGFEGGERRFWKGSIIDANYNMKGGGEKKGVFGGLFKK